MPRISRSSQELAGGAIEIPPRFEEATELLDDVFRRGDQRGIPRQIMLAAAMTDLVPRLVSQFGGAGVAAILLKLANQVSIDDGNRPFTQ